MAKIFLWWSLMRRWHRSQPVDLFWWEVPLAVALFLATLVAVFAGALLVQ